MCFTCVYIDHSTHKVCVLSDLYTFIFHGGETLRRINLDMKQFIGNKDNKIVHDVDNEQPAHCHIDGIVVAGNVITFTPDTLEQAQKEGYTSCKYCLVD